MSEFVYEVTDVAASPGPMPWQTVGPFFGFALPYDDGPAVAGAERQGAFTLSGQVLDGEGQPVPDALLEIWQADEQGRFVTHPGVFHAVAADGFRGFGRCATDEQGRYAFRTVKPAGVPNGDGRPQAPHLAVSLFARGMLRRAVTRVYFDDEAANDTDPLLVSVETSRRHTMVATRDGGGYRFDVHVQGENETVFLHVD
ncbi:MAG TPA: protocatechuate 3,4-dioxygenase subunit alpha [Nocardioidaceae bacterium]|nr:protocatechuate 3,4-dioxygenase subunit alpha [Nocardioidaceae bacterium]